MFFQFISATFSWLPMPLYLIVCAIFVCFSVIILFQLIKVVIQLLEFLHKIFGGLIKKVVSFFV